MPSPPRPLRHSPPRKPLHDRSDSSTNERASPTLRIIGDPQATIYTSTPFPTHPSHILSPKTTRPSGAVLEEVGVSDEHNSTLFSGHVSENDPAEHARTASVKEKETDDVIDADTGSGPQPWPHRTSQHVSPTLNFSPEKERDFDANGRSFIMDQGIDEDLPLEEIVQLPSVGSRPNALSSRSFSSSQKSYQQPVLAKSSDASLSSAESTGTVIRTKPEDRSSRASYSFFPSPTRHEDYRANSSSGPPSIPANPSLNTTRFETSPVSPVSPESPAFSHIPSTTSHRAVSIPRSDVQGNVSVQYPVVRPPTTSGSWAQSSEPSTTHPPQRNPNRSRWWKPHLSTVESVGMTDRSSGSQFFAGSSQVSRDSTGAPNSRSESPPLPAFPRSAYPPRRDITNSTIRVVTEQDDHVGSTLAPVPGSRGSTRFSIFSGSSKGENRRSGPQHSARPSSKGSFFRDSIPAWARTYYGRGGRTSMLPQSHSTDNVREDELSTDPYSTDYTDGAYTTNPSASETSLGLQQPRTRQRDHIGHSRNDSLPITRVRPSEINLVEIRGAPRPKISDTWSPHLWAHRSSVPKRRSLFIAPVIDKEAVSRSPKRRNVQVVLFTVGFVFPLAWFIAAVLPLPPQPAIDEKGKDPARPATAKSVAQDLENRLAPMDEAQYENARWWRNINRLMMIVGVLIIAAIIALAVIATHMKSSS